MRHISEHWRGAATFALAVMPVYLVLVLPSHPRALGLAALRAFPLELPAIVLALLLCPPLPRGAARAVATGLLLIVTVVKVADLAAYSVYSRAFNPVLDSHLAHAAWMLAKGTLGLPTAMGAVVATMAGLGLAGGLLWWATGRIAGQRPPQGARRGLTLAGGLALVATVADLAPGWPDPPGTAASLRLAQSHVSAMWQTRADLARFRRLAAEDDRAGLPKHQILGALAGTDVLLVFVESYGRSTLDNPLYAPRIRGRLAAIDEDLRAHGLGARSAFLTSPVAGGQSWLAHATALSGLWIDNQRRYEALLASPRRTLHHLAREAGWTTVAVMPAITLAWPEAAYFGYDRIYAAADLGYAGPPFNWVTMPDQYTLAAFERAELAPPDRRPVFAEIALISSHAPWTPIPPLIPWAEVRDGSVFAAWANSGDPPEVLWRDQDRVRAQFGKSVDYALEVVGSFAVKHADRPRVMVVLGDHQPAEFVSGTGQNRDVPVHVIAPLDLLSRLDRWGWSTGMTPEATAPVWPMNAFRGLFLDMFGTGAEAAAMERAP